ncbi:MAG: lantibiotic dehydratase [Gemmatimonadetes bacterium]|nr:lantibiotic dehydratase [Gemmatimonadota bacterium]
MSRIAPNPEGATPVIMRVAGLPLETMERFSTDLCVELGARERLEEELKASRAEMVDRLHALVPTAPPELRRFLLIVKRDCYNGRPLGRHVQAPQWPALQDLAGPVAGRLAAQEEEAARRAAAFDEGFLRERDHQRRFLADHLRDTAFVRGLALANPEISWIAQRLRDQESYGHGRRKAEITLLRYVSRAAVKLSPFSTLTPVALGTLRDDLGPQVPRLLGSGWRARSLVRIKPYLLEQYGEMLRRYPPLRDTLPVALNSSATETAPGCFLFLRPNYWDFDEKAGRLGYYEQSLVKVGLRGPLVSRLLELLSTRRLSYRKLVSLLEEEFAVRGTAHQVAGQVDQLVRLGFLHLVLPWSGHALHLEKRMLRQLRSLPPDRALGAFIERLERLVGLEDGYATAADPEGSLREMEQLIEELWRAAAPLGGLDSQVGYGRASIHNVYEEVFLLPPTGESTEPAILHLSRAAAEEALRSVEPLVRLTDLFDHRHEFHHAMAAFAAERWPGAEKVGLLELFKAIRPLWREYLKFRIDSREDEGWRNTWNPLDLPEVEALARHRATALEELEGCLRVEAGVQRVSIEAMGAMLDRIPGRYTSAAGGACLFLQPASTDGTLWMLNRIKEGTGRFSSRYTPAMDRDTRSRYTSHLAARGVLDIDGERVQLLDLLCTQGDNLNVHTAQTPAVLALPGEKVGVRASRQVPLRDLQVSFDGVERRPTLRGRDGQRYVAVYLGGTYEDYVSNLIRFLCVFGPSEMGAVFPPAATHQDGPVTVTRRTILGNVVLHRAAWSFPSGLLREEIAGMSDAQAFAAVNRWRMERGIPDRVFMVERSPHPIHGFRYQPQYLDFTSPLFVALFRTALEAQGDSVKLAETLPTPEMFSHDGAGRRWAVEVLLESVTLRPKGLSSPVPEFGVHVGAVSPPLPAGSRFTRAR